jgi:hypothetical protein
MSEPLPQVDDGFGPFFDIWTDQDLAEALGDHQRAPQARWPAMAVVLVLWYWAFMNRRLPFSQLLYRSWHLVLAFAEKGAARWPPERFRPKL